MKGEREKEEGGEEVLEEGRSKERG